MNTDDILKALRAFAEGMVAPPIDMMHPRKRRNKITYHICTDGRLNHLFDGEKCACNNNRLDYRYGFVCTGKLDVKRITCKKCLAKVPEIVLREVQKAIKQQGGICHDHQP